MKLSVGASYLAIQPASQIIVSDTEKHDFDEKRIAFCVLNKPEKVIAQDGVNSEEIELPEHLKNDEWFFVKDLTTGATHWLNSFAYQISVL